MKVTLNNTFHNTSKTVNLKPGKNIISARRLREWKRDLCCSGCTCSGSDGTRGDHNNGVQSYDVPNGHAECHDDYDRTTSKQILIVDIFQLVD
jgi:hypothetical protein